jgi:hypothetical protein
MVSNGYKKSAGAVRAEQPAQISTMEGRYSGFEGLRRRVVYTLRLSKTAYRVSAPEAAASKAAAISPAPTRTPVDLIRRARGSDRCATIGDTHALHHQAVRFPEVQEALGVVQNRTNLAMCRRFDIPIVAISFRTRTSRVSDFEALILAPSRPHEIPRTSSVPARARIPKGAARHPEDGGECKTQIIESGSINADVVNRRYAFGG